MPGFEEVRHNMELYLIRHGQSTNNALGTEIGRTHDPLLTDTGQRQAEALAAHLSDQGHPEADHEQRSGYNLDHVYCSAMQRALQTAQPVARTLGLKPQVWVEIHEHGGLYLDGDDGQPIGHPGLTRSEILANFPDYVLPETLTDEGWWAGSLETMGAAIGRAISVTEILMERSKKSNERIALISHGLFINLLIKSLFNQLPTSGVYYHHYNTGITRIDIRPDGFVIMRYLNRITHLTPDLVTH